jgi:anti-sigma factor ChrR (cupin superfamily)
MNDEHRCFCELAPLYALDLLEMEDRLWVEAQILACPDLAEELANYQSAIELMPYSAAPVPMAADLKDRLFDPSDTIVTADVEISPELRSDRAMFALRSQDLQWQPHRIPGVQIVQLFVDPVHRMKSLVVKAAAGVVYPRHRHEQTEEIYMLEGELTIGGEPYFAGDYIRSAPGSIHAPTTSTGCMFLIRACIDDEYFSCST